MPTQTAVRPKPTEQDVGHDEKVLEILQDALKEQTNAIRGLSSDLRSEMRSMRHWFVGILALCLLLMAATVGVTATVRGFGVGIDTENRP